MAQTSPLIISGGGIGGLAAALVLAQDGHPVTVLEQAAAFRRNRCRHPARPQHLPDV
ncbi:FAD-binding protein [Polaromonas sp. P1(28)-8]|nr:FAD-binding protein [Polaromonas sp. P1(28)-8]